MSDLTAGTEFDRLYAADPDPWDVATSWYERRKTEIVLASLRRERYRLGWDAACGTGELAAALAQRCDRVLATDASGRACALARSRLTHVSNTCVEVSATPHRPTLLTDPPDLLVLSEFLYYLDDDERRATLDLVVASAGDDADILAVHWAPRADDMRLSGVETHRELDDHLRGHGLGRLVSHVDVEFVLGLWSRDVPERLGR